MNAPLPTFTSSTSAPVPSAIFLLMIDEAISGIDSTVPVTSRRAYSFASAGARPEPAAQMTAPTSSSWASISALDRLARQPGMDSSLSSVPPVWPSPRPDSCGTATPQAATSGASGRVILSPTPPVECLSAVGRDSPEKSSRSPESIIAAVQRCSSAGARPRKNTAMASADICSSAITPRTYASISQSICSGSSVPPSRLAVMSSTTLYGSLIPASIPAAASGPATPVSRIDRARPNRWLEKDFSSRLGSIGDTRAFEAAAVRQVQGTRAGRYADRVRVARFVVAGGDPQYGVVELAEDGGQHPDTVAALTADPLAGPVQLTGERRELDSVRLLAPVIPRSKVVGVGRNFAAHAAELGNEVPETPLIFFKPNTSVIGPGEPIGYPPTTSELQLSRASSPW